jgi:hypothetical protein
MHFQITMKVNNVDFSGGTIEKDVVLDGYLGIYSTTAAPVKKSLQKIIGMLNDHWLSSVFSRTNRERLFESQKGRFEIPTNER